MIGWITVADLASLAATSPRAIQLAITRSPSDAQPDWQGSRLNIRKARGRGGKAGTVYEIAVDSLPLDLQERYKAVHAPFETRWNHGEKQTAERDWRYELLRAALTFKKGSSERAVEIRELSGRNHIGPSGKRCRFSERTVQRMIERYEDGLGVGSLSRVQRSDAGVRRVILSKAFDEGVPFDNDKKAELASRIRQYVRSLIKSGEAPASVIMLASNRLASWVHAAGFDPGPEILASVCQLPLHFVEAERIFGKVYRYKRDRKAYEDAKPRNVRSRAGLVPMALVVGDVHPIDVLVKRADGSIATPRALAWLDIATNRVWMDVVLLEKGQGIRNADVIRSFVNMVKHWGLPGRLYLDNGTEYNWAAFIDDAMKLVGDDSRPMTAGKTGDRNSAVILAQPYNAAAKPIEGIFKNLEYYDFSRIPGWIGGDRLRKKSANVGKAPEPFPGTFAELATLIAHAVSYYDVRPQRGSLRGKSPRQVYEAFVDGGWTMTRVEADNLRAAFSTQETRIVRQGAIQVEGQRWTCRELQAYQGDRVTVLIPTFEDWSVLPLRDATGKLFAYAKPDTPFSFLDKEGAIEAKERTAVHRRAVRELDRSAPDIDPLAERAAYLAQLPAPRQPKATATLKPSDEAAAIIKRLKETKEEAFQREVAERNRKSDEQMEIVRKFGGDHMWRLRGKTA